MNPKNLRTLRHWLTVGVLSSSLTSLAVAASWGNFSRIQTDDSDLSSGSQSLRPTAVPLTLAPDQVQATESAEKTSASLRLLLVREDAPEIGHQELPVINLGFQIQSVRPDGTPGNGASLGKVTDRNGSIQLTGCVPGTKFLASAVLQSSRFSVTQGGGFGSSSYKLQGTLDCGQQTTWIFKTESNSGQPLSIWRILDLAQTKLQESVGLAFWSRAIRVNWPGSGDYYSWGEVNITRGDHWDVVGHELGHAIYDLAQIGAFGGGQHKIDECYSEALALSEGWATFFSGWLSLSLNDSDARFEFIVPRRAPIRLENVPSDVCAGTGNEWRVAAFFWDLIDLNADGETSEDSFKALWNDLANTKVGSVTDAARTLERAGFDLPKLNAVWELNFKRPRS